MTINEYYLIDGFDTSNKEILTVIIEDSIVWDKENEESHLFHLENKLSHYIDYLSHRRFDSMLKNNNFKSFIINLKSTYELPKIALDYLNNLKDELNSNNIKLIISTGEEFNSYCNC